MDRHFKCICGGTAWITREDGCTSIECATCGMAASGETLTLAKQEWQRKESAQRREKAQSPESRPR